MESSGDRPPPLGGPCIGVDGVKIGVVTEEVR